MSSKKTRRSGSSLGFRSPMRFRKIKKSKNNFQNDTVQDETVSPIEIISKRSTKKSGKDSRSSNICICCSASEKRKWVGLAKRNGKSLSAYVRDVLNEELDNE